MQIQPATKANSHKGIHANAHKEDFFLETLGYVYIINIHK